jgi:glycosyltransferase involved in cell wall biosynthesis
MSINVVANKPLLDGIAVIVCTYNGEKRLPKTLAHLAQQIVDPELTWEVIVIDNASTDNTVLIAEQEWATYKSSGAEFTCITEPTPGKINALTRGVLQCKYSFFIICDDDNWLDPTYVQTAYNLLKGDASIGAAGGIATAVNDGQAFPEWFESHQTGYAVGPQGTHRGDVTKREYLFGAGMISRTILFKQAYANFPTILVGRREKKLTAGEDSEYCQRLILMNYRLFYDPALKLQHYMPASRLSYAYKQLLFEGFDESDLILDKYHLITRLKLKVEKSYLNRLRLLIITPFRVLFASSCTKRTNEKNRLRYLLKLPYPKDPILNSIVQFEKEFSKQ